MGINNPLDAGSLRVFASSTSSDGNVGGTTVVCSGLPTNADFDDSLIILTSGTYKGEARAINGSTTGGTIIVAAAFSGQIVSGTKFGVFGIRSSAASAGASSSGTGTLNTATANPHAATISPSSLPTKMNLALDISNLNTNLDDFEIEVSVGVVGSERVIAWYNLTSDGTDISCDTGSGVSSIIKQRRLDLSNIFVFTAEQVIISLKRNAGTDDTIDYKYACGM